MSHRHGSLGATLLLSFLACLTLWSVLLSWTALSAGSGRFLMPTLVLGVPVVLLGTWLRWRGAGTLLAAAVQLVGLAAVWLFEVGGSVIPTSAVRAEVATAWAGAVDSAREYAAPIPLTVEPIIPILLAGSLGLLFAVETLVGRLRAISGAGVLLVAAYVIGPAVTGNGVPWWMFALSAALFLATLHVQQTLTLAAWGQARSEGAGAYGSGHEATRTTAVGVGAVAVLAAIVLPVVLPTPSISVVDGKGKGTGPISVQNPVADLRRDLQRPDDVPLLRVTTQDDRPPTYLRLSVLTTFAGGVWRPGDREIPPSQSATGAMPPLEGVADNVKRREQPMSVAITENFASRWLPTTEHVSEVDAGEDWLYDLSTRDFMTPDDDDSTAGLEYTFTGVDLELDAERLNLSSSARTMVRPLFMEVPSSVAPTVRQLAENVTADAPSRFQKAQALQRWFRTDGGFTYSLRAVDRYDGGDELAAFLDADGGRVGYCEQFAASMAIMARSLDIPARVAVGFLEPDQVGATTWEFSAWDMHAWPELYFPDAGWVRFEPTPGQRAGTVPDYTEATVTTPDTPTPSPTQAQPTEDLPERGQPSQAPTADDEATADSSTVGVWVRRGLVAVLVLALLAGLVLTPGWLRERRRAARASAGPEGAWAELRDHVVDLGLHWPEGRSPRRVGVALGHSLARPVPPSDRNLDPRRGRDVAPDAAHSLDRLVLGVERVRYSPDGSGARADLSADLDVVSQSLTAGVGPRAVRRARWLPRSLFGRSGASRSRPARADAQGRSDADAAAPTDRLS